MKVWSEIEENYFEKNRLKKYQNNSQKHEFDRELRLLNLEILEKIELNFKKYLIDFFEKNWWVKNKELYISKYLEITLDFIKNKEDLLLKNDVDVKKYIRNTDDKTIELYLFIDKLTFWEILKLFRHLKIKLKKKISNIYWINVFIFWSWIYWLKYLRNLCSHSENIYNRKMNYQLEWTELLNEFWLNNSYIVYFLVLSLFEKNIFNSNLWQKKVLKLLEVNKISIYEVSLKQKNSSPSQLESEAWEALVNTLYEKMIKKSNVFLEKTKKINIIFALDEQNGLGRNWDLAWRIKEDMQYFKEVTLSPHSISPKGREVAQLQNAVIMWRKTWDSIPEKYRPLPDRKNIILSRDKNFTIENKEVLVFSDFEEAIVKLSQDKNIWKIFIIWWASIYNLALKSKFLDKIYLTRVKWNFDCDVFVDFREEDFELIENSDWKKNTPWKKYPWGEKWIEFRFEVYKRK